MPKASSSRRRLTLTLCLLTVVIPDSSSFLSSRQISRSLINLPSRDAASTSLASGGRPPLKRNRRLEKRIDRILAGSQAYRGMWGIEVADLSNGQLLFNQNAESLFIPASNLKMFTTAAALEALGPNYVIHTTVETVAPPDPLGHVEQLTLVGRGDPTLGPRKFPYVYHGPAEPADQAIQELAQQVHARGVVTVEGPLIADDRFFVWEPFAPNWAADDLQWGYGAPVTALAFNDNELTLRISPAATLGDTATVRLEPIADYYLLKSRITTTAAGSAKDYHLERQPGSMELDLWGQIPIDGGDDVDSVAIANPPELMAQELRAALMAHGVTVQGPIQVKRTTQLESATQPPLPSALAVTLADHTSPPLSEMIKVINKESQNLHAEMLLRNLGFSVNHQASLAAGVAALNRFVTETVGIPAGETYISDGSGLSREDLIAPEAAVRLLSYMAKSRNFQAFYDSLPVSGLDGTLSHRFVNSPLQGRLHAKTGSVEHVNTLSGYMDLPSGRRLVFSVMANNHALPNKVGQETLDAITAEIYRYFSKHR